MILVFLSDAVERADAAIETAMAALAFDHPISLCFLGSAGRLLDPDQISQGRYARQINGLMFHGAGRAMADAGSLALWQVKPRCERLEILSLPQLMARLRGERVLSF